MLVKSVSKQKALIADPTLRRGRDSSGVRGREVAREREIKDIAKEEQKRRLHSSRKMILQILSRDVHTTVVALCAFNFLDNFLQSIITLWVTLCKHWKVWANRTALEYEHILALDKYIFFTFSYIKKREVVFLVPFASC